MSGRLIAVVGPSGVGKDSIMSALANTQSDLSLVKRYITRAPELGGEDYFPVSEVEFKSMVEREEFCLHWDAHGLRYGIPKSTIEELNTGNDLLVNLSRSVLVEAQHKFKNFVVLSITASEETVRARLQNRKRESSTEIEKRLTRLNFELPEEIDPIEICNDGTLEQAVANAINLLEQTDA